MTDLLFEIGTEEIPARFMPKALADLAQYAAEELDGAHIAHGEIKSECTPRRLVLKVKAFILVSPLFKIRFVKLNEN